MTDTLRGERDDRQSFLVRRYTDTVGPALLSGVQALVRLPIQQMRMDAAAQRTTAALISGYEGSPLAGFDLELGRNSGLLDAHRIVFRPAVNEELAATALAGSQLVSTRPTADVDGVLGIWYGKAPGLDRATDAIRHGNLAGADHRGGVVMLVGDDPATKSSSLPSASELGLIDLAVPVLFPGNVQDVLDYGFYAVALSRLTGLWVSLKIVVAVADATATVDLAPSPRIQPFLDFADQMLGTHGHKRTATSLLNNPIRLQLERELHTSRLEEARSLLRQFPLDEVVGPDDATIGIVAAGKTYLDVVQALERLGLAESRFAEARLRLVKVAAVYPVHDESLRQLAAGLKKLVVVEEKRGPLEAAFRSALYGVEFPPSIVGKFAQDGHELFPAYGELDTDLIQRLLQRELGADLPLAPSKIELQHKPSRRMLPVLGEVSRAPYFCSGCPHSRSTPVPEGAVVGAGIGCHALITRSPRDDLGDIVGLTQMGGEGAQWLGMEPFVSDKHFFQNIGDGTLSHSGSLAIRAAVAAGSRITYKILYNSAVAMTGGQHPTGIRGLADLTRLLKAEGVDKIVVSTRDPDDLDKKQFARGTKFIGFDELIPAQQELAAAEGVTVLIHDQECAAELRRKRKRGRATTPKTKILINPRVCEGCGDCGRKSNCLSVVPLDTEFGDKTQIHQESCNFDHSCLRGHCPSFLTVETSPAPEKQLRSVADLQDSDLPAIAVNDTVDFAIRVTGIGGTGVVTISQMIAMAAMLAGRHVVGIDQTGLAQKGGPVVSDLRVSTSPRHRPAKLATGECDLYLVADLLTGVEPSNLSVASAARTTGVVSTSRVAPGDLIGQPFIPFPDVAQLVSQVESVTRPTRLVTVDAISVANSLFSNDVSANLVLLGAAYQTGALPIAAEHLEQAIALNGVAVHDNVQAFRRGRQSVADPAGLAKAVGAMMPGAPEHEPVQPSDEERIARVPNPGAELRRLLTIRVPELRAYQSNRYVDRYVSVVRAAREAETRIDESATDFSEAVATHLYKLMAYKDEYEVARLSLSVVSPAFIASQLGVGGRVSYNLLPPLLAQFGLRRKIRFGPWVRIVFRVLVAMRWLRGSVIDPFGWHQVRRVERSLIDEYESLVLALSRALAPQDYAWAVKVAILPDLIRGYDDIKLASVQRYRTELGVLQAERPSLLTGGANASAGRTQADG